MKKAILVVSFGTSHEDTRKKTLDVILEDIQAAFPEYQVCRAWTSKMIIRKLAKRDGLIIPTVSEAMEALMKEGVEEVIIQPTHIINGIENDQMTLDVKAYAEHFRKITFSTPLLTTTEDNEKALHAVMAEIPLAEDEGLVFMGHGSHHSANNVYAVLDHMLKDLGYPRAMMGTVEAYPGMEELICQAKEMGVKKIVLAPFMMVAGDHAKNDMAGEEEDSWKNRFEKEGFQVRCILRGLGEYAAIRQIFVDHAKAAMEE